MLPVIGQHFQFVWYKLKYPSASAIPNLEKKFFKIFNTKARIYPYRESHILILKYLIDKLFDFSLCLCMDLDQKNIYFSFCLKNFQGRYKENEH